MSGCATGEGNQQLFGAGIGTALGCGIGYALGGAKGCAIGSALGAASGWGVVAQYQATQVRSAAQDQAIYGVTEAVTANKVQIRKGAATPSTVRAGTKVQIDTDYSLLMPTATAAQGAADVQESFTLKKDGKVLTNSAPKTFRRASGGWVATNKLPIPQNAEAGTYVVETKVQAGSSYDTDETVFIVAS
jgi:hypothetical protein